jgi:23S rRNA (cytosine1962-C5)-methyltransferase
VDPLKGQKTGAYLDQRRNRDDAVELARGRVLDLFCYQGWFSLMIAAAGRPGSVGDLTAVDQSEPALEMLRRDAAENGLSRIKVVRSHVFDFLEAAEVSGERYDTILADPPAFAKSRKDVESAKRGYREVLKRALRVLAPGGRLLFCSCSYHLSPELFRQVLADGLSGAGGPVRVLREGGAGPDHPVRVGFPESQYLKAAWIQKG